MNSKEYQGLMEAYSQVYNNEELSEAPFTWDPNKNVIAAKGPKLGIMTKGDPKSWREPSYQEKGEIPLSSTKAFEKSPAGQKFIQQRDAAKAAKLPPPPSTPTARPAASTPTARPAVSQPKPAPTTSGYKKDTSITDMIGRSQVRQGAPINTGNRSSDIRAMASRSTVGATPTTSAVKPAPTPVNKATGSKKPGSVYSGFDMFDLVKGHLLDEGYADTEEAAIVIMANMSEEWRQNILFQEQSLAQAFAKAGKPGVPSEKPTSTTSLDSLRRRSTSDKARPSGNTSGVLTTPLNQSSYRGRVEAGRNTKYNEADNPDYTGPLRGAGSGTKDKMPGTTPSNNPRLDQNKTKSVNYNSTKPPKPNYNRFI